jgi:molybdate transport system substrate-binding protein
MRIDAMIVCWRDQEALMSAALRTLRFVSLFALLGVAAPAADAAEIKMIVSNAVKEAYLELVPAFEKASGHKVTIDWVGTNDVVRRIGGGEVADVAIASSPAIDGLIKQGKLVPGSRVDVARSTIGVALRPGAPRPDLSSGETLKASLLAAKSIIISSGPSGVYLADLFERMGIADRIKDKTRRLPPGASPGDAVARGEGDIGFTQVSELLPVKGIEYLGPLPADIQHVTTFSAALPGTARQPDAAKAMLEFLTAPASVPVLRKTGLEPG